MYTIVFGVVYKGDSEIMRGRNELFFTRFIEGKIFNGFQDYNIIIDSPFIDNDATDKKEYGSYFSVLLEYPSYSIKYILVRALVFTFPVYPHFSFKHNAVNFLYFFPLYVFILLSLFYVLAKKGLKFLLDLEKDVTRLFVLLMSSGLIVPLFHAFTQVDPDGRYLAPWTALPVLLGGVMWLVVLDCKKNSEGERRKNHRWASKYD
jgi:hypothetical protein